MDSVYRCVFWSLALCPRVGGTWSGKGYQLRYDHCGSVAVVTRDQMAKKGGAVLLLYCKIRELSESLHPIFYIIKQLYTFKFVLETF